MFKKLFLALFLSLFLVTSAAGFVVNDEGAKTEVVKPKTATPKPEMENPFLTDEEFVPNENEICSVQLNSDALVLNIKIPVVINGKYQMFAVDLARFIEIRNVMLGPEFKQEAIDGLIEKYKEIIKNNTRFPEDGKKDALARLSDGTWVHCRLAHQRFHLNGKEMIMTMIVKDKDIACSVIN
jgi:hypothetical protein